MTSNPHLPTEAQRLIQAIDVLLGEAATLADEADTGDDNGLRLYSQIENTRDAVDRLWEIRDATPSLLEAWQRDRVALERLETIVEGHIAYHEAEYANLIEWAVNNPKAGGAPDGATAFAAFHSYEAERLRRALSEEGDADAGTD